jgi:hypothetical protein
MRVEMRKLFFVALASLLCSQAASGTERSAEVEKVGCFLSRGASGVGMTLRTNDAQRVVTPSGMALIECHFDIPAGYAPHRVVTNAGFLCRTYLGNTYNSSAVATPGGKVHLRCQVKPD